MGQQLNITFGIPWEVCTGALFSTARPFTDLGSGTADEEPFIDRAVDRLRRQVLTRRDRG